MRTAIVIPAYNEEKRIGKTLESYSDYFEILRKKDFLDYEILVVINNTQDETEEIVKDHQRKNRRINYLNLARGGKGYAVIEGFKHALGSKENFDLIGFVDADLATGPEAYYHLIKNIEGYDGVIANRYARDSKIRPAFSYRRTVVAGIFNILVRAMFFMHFQDTQCGAKLFSRKAAKFIVENVKMSQWAFDVEILYLLGKRGYKIREASTIWDDVEGSKIKIGKSSIQMLFAILRLRLINSPLKRLLKPLKPVMGLFWRFVK